MNFIMKELPIEFINRIKKIFTEDEYEKYIASFDLNCAHGINLNQKKENEVPKQFNAKHITKNLYTYDEDESLRPGKSIYFDAGLYYIQEPSQMNAVLNLNIEETDFVLDLCAAPGGKTIQALSYLDEEKGGFLISNEIDSKRVKILSSNIERMGYDNCAVTNMSPFELKNHFVECFDKIIVDAPCSGEGMFRKDPNAICEWSVDNVNRCIERQKEIIECAYQMLKPGGKISYSTCTFEIEENEGIVQYLMQKHKDVTLLKQERVYPFTKKEGIIPGEGHFFAIMQKEK